MNKREPSCGDASLTPFMLKLAILCPLLVAQVIGGIVAYIKGVLHNVDS